MSHKPKKKLKYRRANKTGRSEGVGRFVKLEHYLLCSSGWQSLSLGSRCLLIEIWRRHNGVNNGEISYSVREAASSLGCSKNTAAKWFRELQQKGFLKLRTPGSFDYKSRHASEWEITAEPYRAEPASKDFMRWKPADEIQNTAPVRGTDGRNQRDRVMQKESKTTPQTPENPASVPVRETVTDSHGPTDGYTSILPGGFRENGTTGADLKTAPDLPIARARKNGSGRRI